MNPQTRRRDLSWNLTKILFFLLAVLSLAPVSAQTWLSSPGSADWNTDSNWTPSGAPNAQAAAATFATSSTTNVTLGANTQMDRIRFNAGASSYNLDTNGSSLSLYGLGLSNASGAAQTLTTSNFGGLIFFNASTADNIALHNDAYTYFFSTSTASYATITNNVTATGGVYFFDNSTADHATLTNGSLLEFDGSATAASATITNNQDLIFQGSSLGGTSSINNHLNFFFRNDSSTDHAVITNDGNVNYENTATADHGTITNLSGGTLSFVNSSTAGSATITNNSGGLLTLANGATAASATITNSGTLTISDTASAGSATIQNNLTGVMNLRVSSTAGSSKITNAGNIFLYDGATLGTATVTNGLGLLFNDTSTAGSATITNNLFQVFNNSSTAGAASITNNDTLLFNDTSTAGGATITNNDTINFNVASTAGNAVISNDDLINFNASSTAGNSNLTNKNGAFVSFGASSSAGAATLTNQNGGTLSFAVDATANSSAITNNGSAAFYDNSTAGTATVVNNNTMAFNGNSTAGFSTITNNGNLTFAGSSTGGSAAITTTNGADLFFAGTSTAGTVQFDINNGGTFDISSHTGGLTVVSIDGAGALYLGANNLTTGSNNAGTTLSGVIHDGGVGGGTGGSLTKIGTGTLTLSNFNTYIGGTTVGMGTLAVGNSAALGAGSVLVSGGVLATDNGPLLIGIGGNYTQAANGTLRLGLGGTGAGQWDALSIAGTVTLNGTLDLTSYNGYQPALGDTLLIMNSGGVVSGRFSQWTNPGNIRWYPIYQTYQVYLEAIQPSFVSVGLTDNQKAVGAHLDRVFEDPALENLILDLGMQSSLALRANYDTVAPEELTPLYQIGFAAAENQAALVNRRLGDLAGGRNSNASALRASARKEEGALFADNLLPPLPVMDAPVARMPAPENKWGVFVEGIGNRGTIQGDTNGAGYEFTIGGFAAGFDYRFSPDLVGGLLLGYNLSSTTSVVGGKVEDNAAQVGLYGGWNQGGFYLRGLAAGGLNQYKTQRAGYGGTATGETQGLQISGQLACGYDWTFGSFRVGPFASGQYTSVQLNGFQELGSLAPLTFPSQSESALNSEIGFETSYRWAVGSMTLSPTLRASWEHRYQGNKDSLIAGLDSADTFTIQGPVTGTDAAVVEASLSAQFTKGFSASVQYRGKLALQNYDSQSLLAGVQFGF